MTQPAERWARIEQLFHDASVVPSGERAAWLDAQCAGDEALRREVASLLASDHSSSDALAKAVRTAVVDTAGATSSPSAGRRVGPYRLLKEIGQGGMGAVYLAERVGADFRQEVAVKLLRGVVEADRIHRLRVERRILAGLQHPNIARLLDGGTSEGLPYIVMEYVDGIPIDKYCNQRGLSLTDRLRLFCQVCDAVDHAHRSLVVHRDIKPSNILVTADGTPKLLDFGIAKLLDEGAERGVFSPLTGTAIRMFTPEYASPEQIRGEQITTAADTYSLGVLLFQLLTGERPFVFKTLRIEDIERVVAGQDAPKPSSVVRGDTRKVKVLSGDLDTIVLTALAKEPARRYASAGHLAEDIRRFIDDRPIAARPVTVGYRVTRFARRNRWALAGAAVVLAAILGSAVVLVVQAARLQRERDTAEQVTSFLIDLFNVSDPGESRGNTVTAREILDRGADRIGAELAAQPEVQARLLDTIGNVYRAIGLYDRSVETLRQALALHDERDGRQSLETAATMVQLANALRERGVAAEAEPLAREALEIRRRLAGERSVETAESLNTLALVEQARGRWNEAIPYFERAIDIWRERTGPDTAQIATTWNNLGLIYRDRSDFDRGEAAAREALRIHRTVSGEVHPATGAALTLLGQILDARGNDAEAERMMREALRIREQVFPPGHHLVYQSMNNLASVLHDQGKYGDAEPLYRAAVDGARKHLGAHQETAININNLATLMEDAGRYAEAERFYLESLEMRRTVLGKDHPVVARSLNNIARFMQITGRAREALPLIDEALAIRRARLGEDHIEVANSLAIHGAILHDLGQVAEAETLLRDALARHSKQLPAGHLAIAADKGGLARLLLKAGRAGEAAPLARDARDARASQLPPAHWMRGQADALLGEALAARGHDDAAEGVTLMQRGLEVMRKSLPAGDPRIADVERALARYARSST